MDGWMDWGVPVFEPALPSEIAFHDRCLTDCTTASLAHLAEIGGAFAGIPSTRLDDGKQGRKQGCGQISRIRMGNVYQIDLKLNREIYGVHVRNKF